MVGLNTPATTSEPERDAGTVHGVILVACAAITLVPVSLAMPLTPVVMKTFASQPHITELAPLVVVLPLLTVAVASVIAGLLGDIVDRRRLLVAGTAILAIVGVMPAWLGSFDLVLLARAITGLGSGTVIIATVALTGDYFSGVKLQRWLGIQTGATALAAVIVSAASGALAESSWRLSYLLMLSAAVLLAVLLVVPKPSVGASSSLLTTPDPTIPTVAGRGATFALIFVVGLLGTLIIFPPVYEMGVLLVEKALGGSRVSGTATAILSAGAALSAFSLGILGRMRPIAKTSIALGLAGLGTAVMAQATALAPLMFGAVMVGASQGMLGPVLTMWLLDKAPQHLRARAVGAFQLTFCLAGFAAPLIARLLAVNLGSSARALGYYAIADLALLTFLVGLMLGRFRGDRPRGGREAQATASAFIGGK